MNISNILEILKLLISLIGVALIWIAAFDFWYHPYYTNVKLISVCLFGSAVLLGQYKICFVRQYKICFVLFVLWFVSVVLTFILVGVVCKCKNELLGSIIFLPVLTFLFPLYRLLILLCDERLEESKISKFDYDSYKIAYKTGYLNTEEAAYLLNKTAYYLIKKRTKDIENPSRYSIPFIIQDKVVKYPVDALLAYKNKDWNKLKELRHKYKK